MVEKIFNFMDVVQRPDDEDVENELPLHVEEKLAPLLDDIKKHGYTAKVRNKHKLNGNRVKQLCAKYPLIKALIDDANLEYYDNLLDTIYNRVMHGTLSGFITDPNTDEAYPKMDYHDALANTLLKLHPQFREALQDNKVEFVVRSFDGKDIANQQIDLTQIQPTNTQIEFATPQIKISSKADSELYGDDNANNC